VSIELYADVHVGKAVTLALRRREVDVLPAQEDSTTEATIRCCLIARQRWAECFSVRMKIFSLKQRAASALALIRPCIDDLEFLAKVAAPEEMADRVVHLPFR
jgi:hypothetical protein